METKLLPEFQAIVDAFDTTRPVSASVARAMLESAVTYCQELALRVPEMSDAEIGGIWHKHANNSGVWWAPTKAVLAAYESKRFAPVKRKQTIYVYEMPDGELMPPSNIKMSYGGAKLLDTIEWVEK